MTTEGLIIFTVVIALIFDVINGFHDAANAIATVVSTRVLRPLTAVMWAAVFNFVAMFIFAPKVADTVAKIVKIEANDASYVLVICSGLIGAIVWDLATWLAALPTSSSHALIGGLSGAALAYAGTAALRWEIIAITAAFIVIAPLLGWLLGTVITIFCYFLCRNWRPSTIDSYFRKLQLVSAALYAIGHGSNDAQKTMGVIVAVFIAGGIFPTDLQLSLTDSRTVWIIVACQLAMSLGTMLGGWRIVKTMGMKITKLKPIGGFCAETAGAATLFLATHTGIPVSTTHTIIGAIIGVGSVITPPSQIRWGIAVQIVWAWILTLPLSAVLGAVCFYCLYHL